MNVEVEKAERQSFSQSLNLKFDVGMKCSAMLE